VIVIAPEQFLDLHVAGDIYLLAAQDGVARREIALDDQAGGAVSVLIADPALDREIAFHEDQEDVGVRVVAMPILPGYRS
jgi:hypothetical protein